MATSRPWKNWLTDKAGVHIYNLGAGVGSSVLDVVNAFSKACGKPINYHFAPRRDGDLPAYWADAAKADRELNWRVTRNRTKWRRTHGTGSPVIRRVIQTKEPS